MCPLWPLHYILMYILVIGPLWLISLRVVGAAAKAASKWDVKFNPSNISIIVGEAQQVQIVFNNTEVLTDNINGTLEIEYLIDDFEIADVSPQHITFDKLELNDLTAKSESEVLFNVTGKFLGYANIRIKSKSESGESFISEKELKVTVRRETGTFDKAFTYSVAVLVAIIYINMGAALDTQIVLESLKKPIGPVIGFCSQFVIMPLLAYGIAKLLIELPALQLGLFVTGCSPGGGASNIWTLTLGGNLDLSITLTTISTFSAFFMMPLWILTLGKTITEEANLTIPHSKILTFVISIVIPLTVGIIIQRALPKTANFLVKMLKPFAVFLIVFIIAFAIYTNLYLFQLFSWQILISGLLLPWLGFILGGGVGYLLKQSWKDVIAIGIETGVQNTGLAIFALRFSLPQPEADLTTALPVAVAIMTPVLPTCLAIYQRFRSSKCVAIEENKDPLIGTQNVTLMLQQEPILLQDDCVYQKC